MRAFAPTLVLVTVAAAQNTAQNPPRKPSQNPPSTARSQGIVFWNMSHSSIDSMLRHVPQTNSSRLAQLEQIFNDLQCASPNLREQPASEGPNLLCTLPATAPNPKDSPAPNSKNVPDPSSESGTILFLANYEKLGPGQSAIENWTGAIMVPFLYHALSATPRHHTFLFAEVDGAAGAKALFDSFTPDQRHAIRGVVVFDSLGLGPAQFYINPNDTFRNYGSAFLQHQLRQAAQDQHFDFPVTAIPGSWLKIDLTREFRHHGIPSILIHSVTFDTRNLPGSARDTPQSIDHAIYFKTFILLADFATELDQPWPSPTYNPASTPSRGRR
jgi:hypothetical protein